ncbi:biotin-dependent carboxyltransferase family protein [Reichenbachiella agarivorans]|uniref:Biotin-dependent carboxyltransferase family protein n=1 Tax=Reichenbachiella agarivorans TaxID=2979464 RepID=A0ABY6CNY3_9BACT|nr:biotin-dependent carboxyltransferase family protein [Reichenbachiella agarivorans]UXP32231.1 biotin-dependent carboxyltransferase family protein [Reichenbachiella agarivorans]
MSGKLKLIFEKPGLYTTIQDRGRVGQQHRGIPVGGAMDLESYEMANRLVNNDLNTPVLEITLMGPVILFEGIGQIAMTGADTSPMINGEQVALNETIDIYDGDRLTFGKNTDGCRTYLGVRGIWEQNQWLGSVSPVAHSVFDETIIVKHQIVEVLTLERVFPNLFTPTKTPEEIEIGIYPGPELSVLTRKQQDEWVGRPLLISNLSNRMGIRLDHVFLIEKKIEIISSGVFPGVIQLTHAGQPIVLMADAQTTGGYPRIAVVDSNDLNLLAQLKPNDSIWFKWK